MTWRETLDAAIPDNDGVRYAVAEWRNGDLVEWHVARRFRDGRETIGLWGNFRTHVQNLSPAMMEAYDRMGWGPLSGDDYWAEAKSRAKAATK